MVLIKWRKDCYESLYSWYPVVCFELFRLLRVPAQSRQVLGMQVKLNDQYHFLQYSFRFVTHHYTGWFMTFRNYRRTIFPRSVWSKKIISIWVPFSTVVNAPLWTACCKSHYTSFNQLEGEQSEQAATCSSLRLQPSGRVSCCRPWHFQKPT
jgi:hypothetical protein